MINLDSTYICWKCKSIFANISENMGSYIKGFALEAQMEISFSTYLQFLLPKHLTSLCKSRGNLDIKRHKTFSRYI